MKSVVIACLVAATLPTVSYGQETQNILATTQGHYAMGTVEETFAGSVRKVIYLIDTKTGAVWEKGCIQWDQQDKCTTAGLRSVFIADGTGGKLFNTAKAASENPIKAASEDANFGSVLRDSMKKR